jgi:HAD superfamily hydrolase (TIGR01509 family)
MSDWSEIETVFLDMDGTLIDLKYDNFLWTQRLPELFAAANGICVDAARDHLYAEMRNTSESLHFYCLDYWAEFTKINIDALHVELSSLIEFRANAECFIKTVRASGRRTVLVTNAHPKSLAVKDKKVGLTVLVDAAFSSHNLGLPKEHDLFWPELGNRESFDPSHTLVIDDNVSVLRAAQSSGIKHLLCVSQPDSTQPPRNELPFPAFNDFEEIMNF